MAAVQWAAGHSETLYARSTVPFSYASVIAPDSDYYVNVNRTKRDYRQADRSVSLSLVAPSATTAASDGSWATASAFRRSQAVSIVDCRRLLNATRSRPGLITGRYSMTATPGRRRNPRRRQNSPVLTATGRQGTSVAA